MIHQKDGDETSLLNLKSYGLPMAIRLFLIPTGKVSMMFIENGRAAPVMRNSSTSRTKTKSLRVGREMENSFP